MRRPRVLILVENLSVPFDRRVWLEASALRDAGYLVSVICPTGRNTDVERVAVVDDIAIYRYPLPPTGTGFAAYVREYAVAMASTLALSFKVRRKHGFDVIHACNPPDLLFMIALLYRPFGVRFVFDQHDSSPGTFRAYFGRKFPMVHWVLIALQRLTYSTAHHVIVTNESYREMALRDSGKDPSAITVVRTGPDFERLHEVPSDPQIKGGRRHLLVYLGVMGPADGVDLAIRAMKVIVHDCGRSDVHLALLGDGDYAPIARALCTDLHLDEHVEFAGRVSDADLLRYLSTADVCLCPDPANNLNEFSTMNKTMEYMAMGRPVVAFDLKETRYSAGEAALYAEPNDVADFAGRIMDLLDDPKLRAKLGRIGLRRVRDHLAWEHSRPSLLAAYARASGARDAGPSFSRLQEPV